MKVESFTDGQCVEDALCIPVGSGPVEGFAVFNDFMEAATDLFKWGLFIVEVGVEDIDIIQLQPLQGGIEAFLDMLPADETF